MQVPVQPLGAYGAQDPGQPLAAFGDLWRLVILCFLLLVAGVAWALRVFLCFGFCLVCVRKNGGNAGLLFLFLLQVQVSQGSQEKLEKGCWSLGTGICASW